MTAGLIERKQSKAVGAAVHHQPRQTVLAIQNAIFTSVSFAYIAIDTVGVIQIFNDGAERLLGYTAAEVLEHKLTPAQFCDANELAARAEALSLELGTPIAKGLEALVCKASRGIEDIYEFPHLRKDGIRVPTTVAVTALRDAMSDIIGYLLILTDNSSRERSVVALRESEAQLQTIVENISEAVVVADMSGRLLHFNHAALQMLGYATLAEGRRGFDELTDTFELSGLDGNDWTLQQWPIARVLRGEPLNRLEARMRRIGEEWNRTFSFTGNLAHLDGKPVMAVLTFNDITERKRAEASLRESEQRFRTMANSIPQLACIARADGYIVWYNQRWYEYTGTTPEQMEGWGWQSVHDPNVLPQVMEQWATAIQTGNPFEMEFPLRAADGQFRTFLTRVHPLKDSDGNVLQWFGTNTDVDALKRAEEKIQLLNNDLERRVAERTAELLAVNKELEAFSYSVSHDLRAPLRSIDGFSQAILEDCKDELSEQGREYLRRARAASQRMGHLIDDLLNLSRVTRTEVIREQTNLSEIAREVGEECRGGCTEREVTLIIAANVIAEADPRLMRIVLTNLIGNACKFSGKNPKPLVEFGFTDHAGTTEYFVRDNGAGFDMAYVDKLFGAFQRLHSDKDFPGTGIGLATVQRIIHRHGGAISAESASGRGATFRFTLGPSRITSVPQAGTGLSKGLEHGR